MPWGELGLNALALLVYPGAAATLALGLAAETLASRVMTGSWLAFTAPSPGLRRVLRRQTGRDIAPPGYAGHSPDERGRDLSALLLCLRQLGYADRAGNAGAAHTAVSVRVLVQVLLVIVLSEIEVPGIDDLGRDAAVPGAGEGALELVP